MGGGDGEGGEGGTHHSLGEEDSHGRQDRHRNSLVNHRRHHPRVDHLKDGIG